MKNNNTIYNNWNWVDNSYVNYKRWHGNNIGADCVYINKNFKWEDDNCKSLRYFICMSNYQVSSSFLKLNTLLNLTKYIKIFKTKRNWFKAQRTCEQLDGNLISISNKYILENLKKILKNYALEEYWIGLNDFESEGEYKWNNKQVFEMNQVQWNDGYPNNNNKKCVLINPIILNPNKNWIETNCNMYNKFICKKECK